MKLPSIRRNVLDLNLKKHQHHTFEQYDAARQPSVTEMNPTIVQRDSSSSSTCQPGNNSPICAKPTDSGDTQTLPIVLGAVIPICCALLVFVYLHRRHLKKQRVEDANDAHKSLDFGMGNVSAPHKLSKKNIPEMTITDMGDSKRPGMHARGLSMDMDMENPYLLPAGLQNSRESLHSMSRQMVQDQHDPYRPVTFIKSSSDSIRSGSIRPRGDGASIYTSNSSVDNVSAKLLSNARPMSQSHPTRADSMSPESNTQEFAQLHSANRGPSHSRKPSRQSQEKLVGVQETTPPRDYFPPQKPIVQQPEPVVQPPPRTASAGRRPPRLGSIQVQPIAPETSNVRDSSNYGDDIKITPPSPTEIMSAAATGRFSIDAPNPVVQQPIPRAPRPALAANVNGRLSIMGVRPLPPSMPDDNPEQRANRIRSFYKEYFDDSRPNPAGQYPQYGDYYEDVSNEFLTDGAIFDPETGGFVHAQRPFAQPMQRRAMTPPPQGAGRMSGATTPRKGHSSSQSAGRVPRGFHPGAAPPVPKQRMPPPSPLTSLPTPHMLKEDHMVFNPIDFAPPTSYRDRQNGRTPDSPLGSPRPYSPGLKAHVPLATSFDDLAVMPSPHMLRKSGTFTSLDFAPPSVFRNKERAGSDAGSIRSNRSGVSAMQQDAIRAGAYRVSRIPTGVVSTRDDIANQLKPTWDMRSKA